MAHKYEHVSTGNGFSVLNKTVKTQVINQDGTIANIDSSHIYYVDGGKTATYTETGSISAPFKKISSAVSAIQTLANVQIALGTQVAYDTTRYLIKVASGIYDDDFTVGNMKYLGIELDCATISGDITNTTTMIGGAVSDYYSKLEFIGSSSSRANRGRRAVITGTLTLNRNNDSLHYVNFTGVEMAGNVQAGTPTAASNGTFVIGLSNSYFSGTDKYISEYLTLATSHILIESWGYNTLKCKIAKQDDSATKVGLYNCNNTSFENDINITPVENCKIRNCDFTSTKSFSIVASKTLNIDANSYISLIAATETLTGMTVSLLDGIIPDTTTAAQEEVTTTGAISIAKFLTTIDTSAGATAYTLANGAKIGQLKKIILRVDNGDATVTGAFAGASTTLTFSDAGEYALLQWNGTDWIALELLSYLNMAHAPVLS